MIRIGILGYGNLGKGVEIAIKQNSDMELVAIFTRRNPEDLKTLTGAKVVSISEVEEETGYTTDSLERVQAFATSPGFADEVIHVFVARNLKKLEVPVAMDEDEFIELIEVSVEEAEAMMADERIYDAKTAFAVLWMKMNQ